MNTLQEIEAAKRLLKNNGYYIDNLWHILDVKNESFQCSNSLAYEILTDAIEQDGIYESINESINLIVNWEKKNSI